VNLGQPDATLERFRAEWGEAIEVGHVRNQGKILRGMIMYVRRRYKLDAFKDELCGMRDSLERNLENADTNAFLAASGAIAYAYNVLRDTGRTFGGGLHRKPTGDELKQIRRIRRAFKLAAGDPQSADRLDFDDRL
jgi:hypothetical protein